MVTVPDTPAVVESAAFMAFAPSAVPNLPAGFVVDQSYAAVPVSPTAVNQTVSTMQFGMAEALIAPEQVGHGGYIVRGTIDETALESAVHNYLTPDGKTRIFADPDIAGFPTCAGSPPLGTALDVRRLLGAGRLIQQQMDGSDVALAIVDTGINLPYLQSKGVTPALDTHASWTSSAAIVAGQGAVGHGTMCAYDALLSAPNALLFDHAVLTGTALGGSAMSGVLSNAVASYSSLLQLMSLPAEERHFHSMVVSNSWGMFKRSWDFPAGNPGRYGDNVQHPFNIIVGSLAAAGADILFAAGNCGHTCPDDRCDIPVPPIFLANSHPDVTCVAGVDTGGNVVGYSSLGPGIMGNQKPDLAAYTHFLGSEVFGAGIADSGTSAACPVLAGVVAAFRSAFPFDPALPRRSPANVRRFLLNNATGSGAWQNDWGHGIVNTGAFPNAGTFV
jgi:subtilisin family serine protease